MLPEFLAGSYQRYKADTNVFTTWLSEKAIACGYRPPNLTPRNTTPPETKPEDASQSSGSRLKGKARKEAKEAIKTSPSNSQEAAAVPIVKYTLRASDLLRQAEAVSASTRPRVQMPVAIQKVVERAIHARQRCTAWYQETGVKNDYSTEGHVHFIDVLEKTLSILQPCFATTDATSELPVQEEKSKGRQAGKTSNDILSNRFETLQIEDAEDILDIGESDVSAVKKVSPSKKQLIQNIYELKIQSVADVAFEIFCFFEDLHNVRGFLKGTWKKYKAGELDLMTTTITTHAAFDIVRRAEDEIIDMQPKLFSKPRSYEGISTIIFYAESFGKGKDLKAVHQSGEYLYITPFDNFIFLPTARILTKFEQLSAMKAAYPQPVAPIKMSYITRPELLALPGIEKWQEEDLFLSQLLMDMSFNDNIRKALKMQSKREPPVEDELSRGLRKMRKEGEISVWIVFAARIILDIQDILGARMDSGYQELRSAADSASKILDLQVNGNVLTPGSSGECWQTKDSDTIWKLFDLTKYWILNYPLPTMKKMWMTEKATPTRFHSFDEAPPELREIMLERLRARGGKVEENPPREYFDNFRKMNLHEPIQPAAEGSFMISHNPLYCGIMAFNLALNMEKAGIILANHHCSIFAISHLYNALQQTNLIKRTWPEMDKLIDLHLGVLFSGSLPKTCRDFHTRFCLRMGYSIKHYARNRRTKIDTGRPLYAKDRKEGPQLPCDATSEIFRQFFDANKEPMDRCLYQLESSIQESEQSASKKKSVRRQLTSLQFLTQIQDWLPHTISNMSIDYITLTRTCNKLLRRIRSKINEQLDIQHPVAESEDSVEPGNIVMALAILHEASDAQYFKEEVLRARERLPEGPQLQIVGEVMQDFLEQQDSQNDSVLTQ